MAARPAFHLFGFPIHVRPGFLVFLALIVMVNGTNLGLWIAGTAAAFTLLHELGHAFAARATGARAEISLDFLAGYASFVPTRLLKPWERAGISVAGPAVQIIVSVAILLAMGVHPIDPRGYGASAAAVAIWWTGPVMGALNLIPVLPLDGGHIVLAGLDRLIPKRSKTVMLWFSVALTGSFAVWVMLNPTFRGLSFFVIFPLLVQLQMLFGGRSTGAGDDRPRAAAAAGEAHAWATGDVGQIPAGLVPSPWLRAHQQLGHGQPDVARQVLLADFSETHAPDWWPPETAPPEQLRSLVALLPRPLPTGRVYSEHALATILLRIGEFDDAARYAAASFDKVRAPAMAITVARAAGGAGDPATAVGWLHAALQAGADADVVAAAMDGASELAPLRSDPRFTQLRAVVDAAA
jgi:Zn-dependent protease